MNTLYAPRIFFIVVFSSFHLDFCPRLPLLPSAAINFVRHIHIQCSSVCCKPEEATFCRLSALAHVINYMDRNIIKKTDECYCHTNGENKDCDKRCPPRQQFYKELVMEKQNIIQKKKS